MFKGIEDKSTIIQIVVLIALLIIFKNFYIVELTEVFVKGPFFEWSRSIMNHLIGVEAI